MAKTITIANNKGGVGKTMLAYHLANMFADLKEQRVLFVDFDPQGNSTKYFVGQDGISDKYHVKNMFEKSGIEPFKVTDNISIVGSSISLGKYENLKDLNDYFALRRYLRTVSEDYDIVIIDTPPNIGTFTTNALLATDFVVIPVDSSVDAFNAIDLIMEAVNDVRLDHNEKIKVAGIVMNIFALHTNAGKKALSRLEQQYSEFLITPAVPSSTVVQNARESEQTVFEEDSKHKVCSALIEIFESLCKNLK